MECKKTKNIFFEEFDNIIKNQIKIKGINLSILDLGCGCGNTLMIIQKKFGLINLKGIDENLSPDYLPAYYESEENKYATYEGFKSNYYGEINTDLVIERLKNELKCFIKYGIKIQDFLNHNNTKYDIIILSKVLQYIDYDLHNEIIDLSFNKLCNNGMLYICHHLNGDYPVTLDRVSAVLNDRNCKYECFVSSYAYKDGYDNIIKNPIYHHFLWNQ